MEFETTIAGVLVTVLVDGDDYTIESDPPVTAGWLAEHAAVIEERINLASYTARERHDERTAEAR